MLLKFMHEDAKATSLDHRSAYLGRMPESLAGPGVTVPWIDRYGPAVTTIIDGVARVEHGGPLAVHMGESERAVSGDAALTDKDDIRRAVVHAALDMVPREASHAPFADVFDCTSRDGRAPTFEHGLVYWVKAHRGDNSTVLILHDTRAYVCDDNGQTLDRLGP